jgi:transposase
MNDEEIYREFEERAIKSLAPKTHKNKKSKITRIKFDGQFITTTSNKTVWRTKSFAASALRGHLDPIADAVVRHEKDYIRMTPHVDKFIQDMQNSGRLEFVTASAEDFANISQGKR